MISDGDQEQETVRLLSLSIKQISVSREEFEAKLGVSVSRQKDVDAAPLRVKKCLRSSLRHLIDTKIGKKRNIRCVGGSAHIENHEVVFEKYATKAQADGQLQSEGALPWCEDLRGNPSLSRSTRSLPIYCNGKLVEGFASDSPRTFDDIMICASYLYCQLWWFRAMQRRAVSTAIGIALFLDDRESLMISMLLLEKPCSGSIGTKFNLYEYQTKSTEEMATFLIQVSGKRPSSWQSASLLDDNSPGCMLLPDNVLSAPSRTCDWEIVPTITGSLVIRCNSLSIATELASESAAVDIDLVTDSGIKTAWYLKAKTAAGFGLYWDTATMAIDRTRSLLKHKWNKWDKDQKAVANQWLSQYPIDSFSYDHCNILVMRGCGEVVTGQLSWSQFAREMNGLILKTLLFQQMTDLVHGDIHEGNILFDAAANAGNQFVLIDWDEALRKQPCYRKTDTEEEKRRYPSALVGFPEEYTKHQLLVVCESWLQNYYHDKGEAWKSEKELIETKTKDSGLVTSVNECFKSLLQFLGSF